MKIKRSFSGLYYYEDGTFKSPMFDSRDAAEKSMNAYLKAADSWSRVSPANKED